MKGPLCYYCNKKKAKRLNLPGSYGHIACFCSLRCAAMTAMEPCLCGAWEWCDQHKCWENDEAQEFCQEEQQKALESCVVKDGDS